MLDFKTYHKATVIKKQCGSDLKTDSPEEKNSPEINPFMYGQMIFETVSFSGERTVLSRTLVGKAG